MGTQVIQSLAEGTSMGAEINTGLTNSITPSGIVGEFISYLPWIGGMVAAAFAIYEVRKLIKGASKGKVRV